MSIIIWLGQHKFNIKYNRNTLTYNKILQQKFKITLFNLGIIHFSKYIKLKYKYFDSEYHQLHNNHYSNIHKYINCKE